eukprot:PhF_6_TR34127/c0_g1_i1/m.49816
MHLPSLVPAKEIKVWSLIISVLFFGGLNRVFYKILVTPMSNDSANLSYSFFVSLFGALAYCVVYFSILGIRYCLGHVTKEMLRYPWTIQRCEQKEGLPITTTPPLVLFICMGVLDGLGNILGLISAPYISGAMISLMSQAIVAFSMASSILMLRTRYTMWQILGACVILTGAGVALVPDLQSGAGGSVGYNLVTALSTLPNAISFTLREVVFLNNPGIDIFIVNSHGSLWQLLLTPIFLPLTLLFNQTSGQSLGTYIENGLSCFVGETPDANKGVVDCSLLAKPLWTWLPIAFPYLCYMVCNVVFNISLLFVVKYASALQSFMAIKAVLPISVVLFYIKWPLIPQQPANAYLISGLIVILIGLGVFRFTTVLKDKHKAEFGAAVVGCGSMFPFCFPSRAEVDDLGPLLSEKVNEFNA